MTTFRNKTVLFISNYVDQEPSTVNYRFNNIIIDPEYYGKICDKFENKFHIKKDVLASEIPENPIFYFGSTSKYPRFKIKEKNYKRCNTCSKSNIQVVGNFSVIKTSNVYIFEKDDCYYAISNLESNLFYVIDRTRKYGYYKSLDLESVRDKIDFLFNKFKFNKLVYNGPIISTTNVCLDDILSIINEEFTNIITDDILDSIINKSMEDLTIEDADLLYDLINSKDISSVELGLKMLIGYNYSKYPHAIKLLLNNENVKNTKAWTSTGVKRIKESIKFNQCGWNPQYWRYYLFSDNKDDETNIDKDDLAITHHLWKKIMYPIIENNISKYNIPGLTFKFYAE